MIDIVTDLAYSPTAVLSGRQALAGGATILCDCRMVAEGITRSRLSANNPVICTLNAPEVPELAKKLQNTRSAAALELWLPYLAGSVVAIGNAPTALFRLLSMLDEGGFPSSFDFRFSCGVCRSSRIESCFGSQHSRHVPFITLHGRRGGSAIAAAAVNALAMEKE